MMARRHSPEITSVALRMLIQFLRNCGPCTGCVRNVRIRRPVDAAYRVTAAVMKLPTTAATVAVAV
jgi:hypothetical protein